MNDSLYKVNFDDIIGVQPFKADKEKNMAFALRTVYEKADKPDPNDTDTWPKLTLKIKAEDIDESKYKECPSDIISVIVNEMARIANHKEKIKEDFKELLHQIISAASSIAISTRRGAGNFVFIPEFYYDGIQENYGNVIITGKINGTLKVFSSPHIKDKIVIGYKGPGQRDTGLILSTKDDKYQLIDVGDSRKYYVVLEA